MSQEEWKSAEPPHKMHEDVDFGLQMIAADRDKADESNSNDEFGELDIGLVMQIFMT